MLETDVKLKHMFAILKKRLGAHEDINRLQTIELALMLSVSFYLCFVSYS